MAENEWLNGLNFHPTNWIYYTPVITIVSGPTLYTALAIALALVLLQAWCHSFLLADAASRPFCLVFSSCGSNSGPGDLWVVAPHRHVCQTKLTVLTHQPCCVSICAWDPLPNGAILWEPQHGAWVVRQSLRSAHSTRDQSYRSNFSRIFDFAPATLVEN